MLAQCMSCPYLISELRCFSIVDRRLQRGRLQVIWNILVRLKDEECLPSIADFHAKRNILVIDLDEDLVAWSGRISLSNQSRERRKAHRSVGRAQHTELAKANMEG